MALPPITSRNGSGLAVAGATIPFETAVVVCVVVLKPKEVSTAGMAAMPAAESTQVFMFVICARVMLSDSAFRSATTADFMESLTGFRGAMKVVNCAAAAAGAAAIMARATIQRFDTVLLPCWCALSKGMGRAGSLMVSGASPLCNRTPLSRELLPSAPLQGLLDQADGALELAIRRIEVWGDPDSRSGPVIDEDVSR